MSLARLNAKTLIIEDFEGMRTVLKGFCKSIEITNVDYAASGTSGLALLSKNRYDIVICDYDLGPGPNGQQVLEEAKYRKYIGYGCVWIIITGEKTMAMVASAVETQADDYLLKPVSAAMLESRLLKLSAKKASFRAIEDAVNAHDYPAAMSLCDRLIETKAALAADLQRIKADLLLATNDLEGAAELFQAILAKRSVPWAKTGLGKVYFHRKEYELAKHLFREALDESRVYLEAADWLAKVHDALDEGEQAQTVLERATALYPQSTARQKTLAEIAHKNGVLDVAQTAYQMAIKSGEHSIHKSPALFAGLARVFNDKEEPIEALAVLDKGRQEFKDNAEAAVQTAVVQATSYRMLGDRAKAEAAIEEAGALMEGLSGKVRAEVTVDMAKTLFALGKQEEACGLLQNLVMENHEDTALMNQVQSVLEANEMEVDTAKELVEKSRMEVVEINNEGVLLARAGKFAEAIELLRNAVQRVPNNVVMVNNLCGVLIASMKRDGRDEDMVMEAKMLIDRVGELSPGHAKYYEYLNVLTQLGPIEAAAPPPAKETEAAPEPAPEPAPPKSKASRWA